MAPNEVQTIFISFINCSFKKRKTKDIGKKEVKDSRAEVKTYGKGKRKLCKERKEEGRLNSLQKECVNRGVGNVNTA